MPPRAVVSFARALWTESCVTTPIPMISCSSPNSRENHLTKVIRKNQGELSRKKTASGRLDGVCERNNGKYGPNLLEFILKDGKEIVTRL